MSENEKFHVQRHTERENYDRLDIEKLLDSQYVAHVGFVDPEINSPFVIPMGFARDNNRILIHGSTGSRIMMAISSGIDLCVTITQLNAIVVARSAFNSSMNYESVMIFGKARVLTDEEKRLALDKISAKKRDGEPSDDEEDIHLPLWAGILPLETSIGPAVTATNAKGIPIPHHMG